MASILSGIQHMQLGRLVSEAPGLRSLDFGLAASSFVFNLWHSKRIVGFSRAATDGTYRAVLWDVVVTCDREARKLGRQVVGALINEASVDNPGLLTNRRADFNEQVKFKSTSIPASIKKYPNLMPAIDVQGKKVQYHNSHSNH